MKTSERVLNYIREHIDRKGYPPTVREIGQAVGVTSTSTVHSHLDRMEKKGILRRDPLRPRGIELMDPPKRKIPAGEIEQIIDYLEKKSRLVPEYSAHCAYLDAVEQLKLVIA